MDLEKVEKNNESLRASDFSLGKVQPHMAKRVQGINMLMDLENVEQKLGKLQIKIKEKKLKTESIDFSPTVKIF